MPLRTSIVAILLLAAPVLAQDDKSLDKVLEKIVVPFDTIKSRHMIVDVTINGKGPFTLVFDTGAPVTLVSAKLAQEAKVGSKEFSLAALFGGQHKKIDKLEMGGIKLDKVDAMVMDHPVVVAISGATGKKLDGIVGFNVFGRYKTTIDYQAKTITFVPTDYRPVNMIENLTKMMSTLDPDKAPVVAPKSVLGLTVAKKADDEAAGVDVTGVFEASPAAKAGLQKGDRILTIDDRWTDRVVDCHDAVSRLAAGQLVDVVVVRDGNKKTIRVTTGAGF